MAMASAAAAAAASDAPPPGEPIAIVGMACRLPGNVSSPSDLWQALLDARSAQGPIPPSRWTRAAFHHPDIDYPGAINQTGGYFLAHDVNEFDNAFFGINNLEAGAMDPQQRNLLEVVYEALESGGVRLDDVSGAPVGCYVANFTADNMIIRTKDPESVTRHRSTGTGLTILSNRISHIFNLAGPSVVMDTACSSSVYALHFACLALQAHETSAAIVAGTNLLLTPEQHLFTSKLGVLSPTSTCHWADASADGYGRADGIGALYVKRLSDALRDGDPIRSVIRGTALNCNGRTFGITLPSTEGQEAVIRAAYAKARVSPDETDYVECHGTGTAVGDPIEIEALSRVFKNRSLPLRLGSVKSNMGHSEAASGIAGIIKASLILESGIIPPSHGVRNINPKIKTKEWNVDIVTENTPWPARSHSAPRRVSINSFGYGGANAHVVLEGSSSMVPYTNGHMETSPPRPHNFPVVLPFSASTPAALQSRIDDLAQLDLSQYNFDDLAYTLGCRRTLLPVRGYLIARPDSIKTDMQASNLVHLGDAATVAAAAASPLAFIFTGQGAQWPQMGLDLVNKSPVFAASLGEQDEILQSLVDAPQWTLRGTIQDPAENSRIQDAGRSQPVCTAVQIALVDLLAAWGLKPRAVVGHSSGEIAAAYAAGHITKRDAVAASYYRGLVVSKSTFKGAMMAVSMSDEQAAQEISDAGLTDLLRVGCMNSPSSSTISGAESAIDTLLERLQSRQLFARKLRTGGKAYHSFEMSKCGDEYEAYLGQAFGSEPLPPASDVTMYSSVLARTTSSADTRRPSYWRENLESPVRFNAAVQQCLQSAAYHLVEVGPHSALELPLKQIHAASSSPEDSSFQYATALTRGRNSADTVLHMVGKLFLNGHSIQFDRVNHHDPTADALVRRRDRTVITGLPKYAWTRDAVLWEESRRSTEYRFREYPHHELLGASVPGASMLRKLWRKNLRLKDAPWLEDHRIESSIVFPGAGYLALAIEALSQYLHLEAGAGPKFVFGHVRFLQALNLSADPLEGIEVLTEVGPVKLSGARDSSTWFEFDICSVVGQTQTTHATGRIRCELGGEPGSAGPLYDENDWQTANTHHWYEKFTSQGLNYGPRFQGIRGLSFPKVQTASASASASVSATALIALDQAGDAAKDTFFAMHPSPLDALFQCGILADSQGSMAAMRSGLPVSIEKLSIATQPRSARGQQLRAQAVCKQLGFGAIAFDVRLYDQSHHAVVEMEGVRCAQYHTGVVDASAVTDEPVYSIAWKPDISFLPLHTSLDSQLAFLDMYMHKYPASRVLLLGSHATDAVQAVSKLAGVKSRSQRCLALVVADFSNDQILGHDLVADHEEEREVAQAKAVQDLGPFDVVVFAHTASLESWLSSDAMVREKTATAVHWLVAPGQSSYNALVDSCYKVWNDAPKEDVVVAKSQPPVQTSSLVPPETIYVITPNHASEPSDTVEAALRSLDKAQVQRLCFAEVSEDTIPRGATLICTPELEDAFLIDLTPEQLVAVRVILETADHIIWLTSGGLGQGKNPNVALASAFYRTLRLEYYPVKVGVVDVDQVGDGMVLVEQTLRVLNDLRSHEDADNEYILENGVLHVSRVVPDEPRNAEYLSRHGRQIRAVPRKSLGRAELGIERPGNFSSLHMRQLAPEQAALGADEVEVAVTVVGVNAKDMYALSSRVDTHNSTCSLECVGIVQQVGSAVAGLGPGARVLVMAPGKFATVERFPSWACVALDPQEDALSMSTVPVVFSSALYALRNRANLQPGERVLIHSAAGGLGQAAIQYAKSVGAEIFATVGTQDKREFLSQKYGIPDDHIFDSRSSSFLASILQATAGQGVDVVLNSLVGDQLHAGWQCCGEFARFIEVGKADILESGKLDMSVFKRGATFSAFDLADLYYSANARSRAVWQSLLQESVAGIRAGTFEAIQPLKAFDISEVGEAFGYMATKNRIGKVAVTLDRPDALVQALAAKFSTDLCPDKSYLLVGCLGGIGRTVSRWMMQRGARHFIFIGRSGLSNPTARALVDELQRAGAQVDVVQGSVNHPDTVHEALGRVKRRLGGVLHAAMAAKEGLFNSMTWDEWQLALEPKVRGTWALHHALAAHEASLDFFIMTSSMAGSVGQPGESSYCAANAFLDAFAKHRRHCGLRGTAVALGAVKGVGYLAEHPEQEAILHKAGYMALTEDELLHLLDLAICNDAAHDDLAPHFLTGISGQTRDRHIRHLMRDPRAVQLRLTMERLGASASGHASAAGDPRGLPQAAQAAMAARDDKALRLVIEPVVADKLARLVQTPVDRLKAHTRLSDIGMDSMLAVEARQSATLGVNIPIMEFMMPTATIGDITKKVADGLLAV